MLNKPAVAYICELKNIFKKILFSKWTRVTVHFCMHTHKLHKIAKDAYIHVQPAPTCANGVCCLDLFFYSSSMFTSSQPITIRKNIWQRLSSFLGQFLRYPSLSTTASPPLNYNIVLAVSAILSQHFLQ